MINKKDVWHYFIGLSFCIIGGMFGAWSYEYVLGQYTNSIYGPVMTTKVYRDTPVISASAKQVVLEQDAKVIENIYAMDGVLMGLFQINKAGSYDLSKPNAQALIISSDGWIVSNYINEDKNWHKNFVAIDSDGKLFKIDNRVDDELSAMVFLHLINAKEMRVPAFAKAKDLRRGQLLLNVNWLMQARLNNIALLDANPIAVKSSEVFLKEIKLHDELSQSGQLVAIDLKGSVVALYNRQKKIVSADYFVRKINELFAKDKAVWPYLGINYTNESWKYVNGKYFKGVRLVKNGTLEAVIKDSPADKAGLEEGDVVLTVDNVSLGREVDLIDLLYDYKPKDKISLRILRDDKERVIDVVLGVK